MCSTGLLVGSARVDLGVPVRTANGVAEASYDLEYEGKGNVPDVLFATDEVNRVDAELHQIWGAADVAAVVSRDGDDARRIDVSYDSLGKFCKVCRC